jgi:hypothetical protein
MSPLQRAKCPHGLEYGTGIPTTGLIWNGEWGRCECCVSSFPIYVGSVAVYSDGASKVYPGGPRNRCSRCTD